MPRAPRSLLRRFASLRSLRSLRSLLVEIHPPGLVGMVLAGQPGLPLPLPIGRLVLNDVGPAIAWASVQRMQQYVGQYGQYRDLDEAAAAMWALSTGFGPVPAEVWRDYIRTVGRTPNGIWGGKLMWNQTPLLLSRAKDLPESSASGLLSAIRDVVGSDPVLIHVYRPDVVLSINHHDSWGGPSWNHSDHRAVLVRIAPPEPPTPA